MPIQLARKPYWLLLSCALALPVAPALSKVSAEEADKLKSTLTPLGGERAANKDGSIPAWDGGLSKPPACFKGEGTRYCDPFPQDKPLYTITPANVEQYKDKLSAGQLAMFRKYSSYKMNVYPTRRTVANPEHVYEATHRNALQAELGGGGEALVNAIMGIPFPIPGSGVEPIWNHKVRYRGVGTSRWNVQAVPTAGGAFEPVKIKEDVKFNYSTKGATPASLENVIIYFLQVVTAPARLSGTIVLVHDTMDQVAEPRRAWAYNSGRRRLLRAPETAYDQTGTASDGQRTTDQTDTFNGATDRYDWKIVGKKEMLIPYNSYVLHSDKYKYRDIIKAGHIVQDLPRYELHRVWVVDATLTTKKATRHIYKRRTFYIDEDSWQMALVDVYDDRDQLWRWQEVHSVMAYDRPFLIPIWENIYDLRSGRYLVQSANNEESENVEKDFDKSYFDPTNVVKKAAK